MKLWCRTRQTPHNLDWKQREELVFGISWHPRDTQTWWTPDWLRYFLLSNNTISYSKDIIHMINCSWTFWNKENVNDQYYFYFRQGPRRCFLRLCFTWQSESNVLWNYSDDGCRIVRVWWLQQGLFVCLFRPVFVFCFFFCTNSQRWQFSADSATVTTLIVSSTLVSPTSPASPLLLRSLLSVHSQKSEAIMNIGCRQGF